MIENTKTAAFLVLNNLCTGRNLDYSSTIEMKETLFYQDGHFPEKVLKFSTFEIVSCTIREQFLSLNTIKVTLLNNLSLQLLVVPGLQALVQLTISVCRDSKNFCVYSLGLVFNHKISLQKNNLLRQTYMTLHNRILKHSGKHVSNRTKMFD